jgi:hypothetical protein
MTDGVNEDVDDGFCRTEVAPRGTMFVRLMQPMNHRQHRNFFFVARRYYLLEPLHDISLLRMSRRTPCESMARPTAPRCVLGVARILTSFIRPREDRTANILHGSVERVRIRTS